MLSFFQNWLFGGQRNPLSLLLLGFDTAGKTAFLFKIRDKFDENKWPPIAQLGVETLEVPFGVFSCWDLDKNEKIRKLIRLYTVKADAIIFLIDGTNRDQIESFVQESPSYIEESKPGIPLLYLVNKIDLPNCMSNEEILQNLHLETLTNHWNMYRISALTGEGFDQCIDWMKALHKNKKLPANPYKQISFVPQKEAGQAILSTATNQEEAVSSGGKQEQEILPPLPAESAETSIESK